MANLYKTQRPIHNGYENYLDISNPHVHGMVLCLPVFEQQDFDIFSSGKRMRIREYTRDTVFETPAGSWAGNPAYDYGGLAMGPSGLCSIPIPFPDSWLTGSNTGEWRTFNDFTFMWRFYKIQNLSNGVLWSCETFGNDGLGSANRTTLLIRTDDATPARGLFFSVDGSTIIDYIPSPNWAVETQYTLTLTRTGSAITLYEDGAVVATGTNSTAFRAHRPTLFRQYQSDAYSQSSRSSLHYCYAWERGMEEDEIHAIESDPWKIFPSRITATSFFSPPVIPPVATTGELPGAGTLFGSKVTREKSPSSGGWKQIKP